MCTTSYCSIGTATRSIRTCSSCNAGKCYVLRGSEHGEI